MLRMRLLTHHSPCHRFQPCKVASQTQSSVESLPRSFWTMSARGDGEALVPPSSEAQVPRVRAYITLIRHGESQANVARVLQGVSDSPLTVHGAAQVEALGRYWRAQHDRVASSSTSSSAAASGSTTAAVAAAPAIRDAASRRGPCNLLVASPVGRAKKTAESIARNIIDAHYGVSKTAPTVAVTVAAGSSSAGKVWSSDPLTPDFERDLVDTVLRTNAAFSQPSDPSAPTSLSIQPAFYLDPGLAERDFGFLESTKGGVAPAGYKRGSGTGEGKNRFEDRVRAVGRRWIQFAWQCALTKAGTLASSSEGTPVEENPFATPSTQSTPSARTPDVHIILVSHGLWISTFFGLFAGPEARPSFAANTGMFTIELSEPGSRLGRVLPNAFGGPAPASRSGSGSDAARLPSIRLVVTNDVSHLTGVKRQKGGISNMPDDGKQSKLSSFFSPKRARKE